MDIKLIAAYLGMCKHPKALNLRDDRFGDMNYEAIPRGLFGLGGPISGKSVHISNQMVRMFVDHPEASAVVLDMSGPCKNGILESILGLPEPQQSAMLRRVRINILGHPKYVKAQPEFHPDYKLSKDEQAARVSQNLQDLNPDLSS